jgi:hypothetical protein
MKGDDLHSSERKLVEEDAWYFALVLLGAGINAAIIPAVADQVLNFIGGSSPILFYEGVVLYAIVGIVYCTAASLMFTPKRHVSPVTTQFIAVPILAVLFADYLLRQAAAVVIANYFSSASAVLVFVLTAMILYLVGSSQSRIVRYFVGLKGTKEDTLRDLWLLDRKLDDVLSIMSQKELLHTLNLSPGVELGIDTFLFRTVGLTEQRLFLVAHQVTGADGLTELGSVAYEVRRNEIRKTSDLDEVAKMRMTHLKGALTTKGVKIQDLGANQESSEALQLAYEHAMRPTDIHILGFARLPVRHRLAAFGLALIFIATTAAWLYNILTTENYEVALILVGISFFVEFLLNIQSRTSKALRLVQD